jgi:phage tail sheath protein FI
MANYLSPGVYTEEEANTSSVITGVGTSVAAIVGPTRTGPLRGRPEVLTSFADFVRTYGDAGDLIYAGTPVLNHTALAANFFFNNGGSQLFMSRVVAGVNSTGSDSSGSTAAFAVRSDVANNVNFSSRFPGEYGNVTLELEWRDSENLLKTETTSAPREGEVVFLEATGVENTVRSTAAGFANGVPNNRFPMDIRALVRRVGDSYVIDQNRCEITPSTGATTGVNFRPDGAAVDAEGELLAAGLINGSGTTVRFTRVYAKSPASGALADGTSASVSLSGETDLSNYTGGAHWGTLTTLRGTLNAGGDEFTLLVNEELNPGVLAELSFPLAALAARPDGATAMMIQRNFDINVRTGGADGEVVYSYSNISTSPDAANSLAVVLTANPVKRADALSSPVACTLDVAATGDDIVAALYSLFDDVALSPDALSVESPRFLIALAGGSDGDSPVATDYAGEVDEVNGNTGFAAFEDVEDIAIVMSPAAAASAPLVHQGIVTEMQIHCRRMRYRVGIVDSREGMAISEVREFRNQFDDSRLALYYPWVVASDPTGVRETITVPPAGFIAGIYANTDVQRGVHKAPANESVIGALRFAQDINRFQQDLLNPDGINCLRSFPGRGHRVWGARTLSSNPDWTYLNVRRYFLYLEKSVEKSTHWIVFEPNNERLWEKVRSTVEDFLYTEWFNGRLVGASPKNAYFVICDRSTMTDSDLLNGILKTRIGVAVARPAEFVVFQFSQKAKTA